MPKKESNPLRGAEKIREDGEPTPVRVFKQNGRSATAVETPLNLRDFQVRPNRVCDANELPGSFEIANGFAQTAVAHEN